MPRNYKNLHLQLVTKMSACGKITMVWRPTFSILVKIDTSSLKFAH
ncbi:hypothetical protein GYH30_040177 [Glycine max]|nr:hypothetical protein GYH30_040177 [Glycine max]